MSENDLLQSFRSNIVVTGNALTRGRTDHFSTKNSTSRNVHPDSNPSDELWPTTFTSELNLDMVKLHHLAKYL